MAVLDPSGETIDGADDVQDQLPDNIQPGSAKAKLWWKQVEAQTHQDVTPEMKAKYGSKVVGAYKGKALVPGEAGRDQGDFQYLVDKLMVTRGLSKASATKIAGSVNAKLYGGG